MTDGLRQFSVLSRLAFTELVRQPVCLMVVLTTVALSIVLPMSIAHQLGQQGDLARDGALAFEFVGGAILAAFAACSTLSRETRSGTLLTVLSRPVSRHTFFLAKFGAVAALLALFIGCSACAALLAERMAPRFFETDARALRLLGLVPLLTFVPAAWANWRHGASFTARAWILLPLSLLLVAVLISRFDSEGHAGHLGQYLDTRLIPATVLVGVGLLILAALALALATHLPLAPTAGLLLGCLFAGLLSDHLAGLWHGHPIWTGAIRGLLPDLQRFWPADDLAGGAPFGWSIVGRATLYGVAYAAGLLCLGVAAFRQRQF